MNRNAEQIIRAREHLNFSYQLEDDAAAEGGCGVLGLAANVPIAGKHVLLASKQMNNRGNGKGGGIAMVGLDPAQMGVSKEILQSHYLLQIALLDSEARQEVEEAFINPYFEIAVAYEIPHVDYRSIATLEVKPPDVWRYFVRVKTAVLDQFRAEKGLDELTARQLEDEFVYQNSNLLNQSFYASLGEKRAFVLSHARNLIVLKIVGFAEDVVSYYQLDDVTAKVWIAHQRYPTKGRVWHPGGAHPFIGMNEALVHNGDFANYHAVGEYLQQRNIQPMFLTDTEVSVQLFDLWNRVYQYPLEVTLEAMAPTSEHDFTMLSKEKQQLYQAIQATHLQASPDGPWFFILARSNMEHAEVELLGITDTSMLRPQVFALYENDGLQIGLIGSERQAVNACLRSLTEEDDRFQPFADQYWVARGGSHTDGGSFRFTINETGDLVCQDKFSNLVVNETIGQKQMDVKELVSGVVDPSFQERWEINLADQLVSGEVEQLWFKLVQALYDVDWVSLNWGIDRLLALSRADAESFASVWQLLNHLRDRMTDLGNKKRASLLALLEKKFNLLFNTVAILTDKVDVTGSGRLDWENRKALRAPLDGETRLLIDTIDFPPEGVECAANLLVAAHKLGWTHLIAYNWRGGRFAGSGLGMNSHGLRIDLYGDVGDYTGSGLDGAELHIHADGQDQLGQVLKAGRLVIHGDVGQTFLYGAKGGDVYVRGSAAGRPLINAVGRPHVVINGTCLDYLAESFMAGDPLNGGGFAILNGVKVEGNGRLVDLPSPYPGGNLLSLASGGAIYVRDPEKKISAAQLNGGVLSELQEADWQLIFPYLVENERQFGISVNSLLKVDGVQRTPFEVYRKVEVDRANLLKETENR